MNNRCLIIIFLGLNILSVKQIDAMGGGDWSSIAALLKSGVDGLTFIGNKISDVLGGNGQKIAEAINKNSEAIKNATETIKNNGEKFDTFGAETATAAATGTSWYIGSSIKNWIWPSKKEKIQRAFEALNKCLINNKEKAKDKDGMPYLCEDVMKQYAEVAGFAALNEVKTAYAKN